MAKISATCGNLDFDGSIFKMENGCIGFNEEEITEEGTYVLKATCDEDGVITYAFVKEVTE